MSGSCLGALFIQNPEGIEENCRIERKQLRETVYRLSATEHLVFSPNPLITQIECKNGSHFPLRLKATSRISIPEGCSAQLHNHTIYSDPTLRIAPEALHFTWDFNPFAEEFRRDFRVRVYEIPDVFSPRCLLIVWAVLLSVFTETLCA